MSEIDNIPTTNDAPEPGLTKSVEKITILHQNPLRNAQHTKKKKFGSGQTIKQNT